MTKTEASGEIILAHYPQFEVQEYDRSYFSKDTSWLIKQGMQYLENGHDDEAIRFFDKAITLDKNSFTSYNYKGYAFFHQHKLEEASKCFDSTRKIAASNSKENSSINKTDKSGYLLEEYANSVDKGTCVPS